MREDGAVRTPRLLLRGAQESDLDPMHGLFRDEDVMRYWYLHLSLFLSLQKRKLK